MQTLGRKDQFIVRGNTEDRGFEMSVSRSIPGPLLLSAPIETTESTIPAGHYPRPPAGREASAGIWEPLGSNQTQFWIDKMQLGWISLGEPLRVTE